MNWCFGEVMKSENKRRIVSVIICGHQITLAFRGLFAHDFCPCFLHICYTLDKHTFVLGRLLIVWCYLSFKYFSTILNQQKHRLILFAKYDLWIKLEWPTVSNLCINIVTRYQFPECTQTHCMCYAV